jgi:hypothetical protein
MSSNDKDEEVFKSVFNVYLTWSYLDNLKSFIKEHTNMNVVSLRKQATKKQSAFYGYELFIVVAVFIL